MPSYLSFLPSFLFYRYLSINEKIKAILVLLKIKFIKNIQSEDLQNISFKDWLKNNNQSEKSIRNFWDLIILPTLNDHSSNVTTSMALMVFKTTLLGDRHASDIGFAQYGLSTVMGTPMKDKLVDCGVSLLVDELNKCLPLTASAKIKRFIIIKEQRATFRNLPGASINNRLKSATPLDNFYLAGDWTDTGWPSTMEGAVISGNLAAKAIIARDGSGN